MKSNVWQDIFYEMKSRKHEFDTILTVYHLVSNLIDPRFCGSKLNEEQGERQWIGWMPITQKL